MRAVFVRMKSNENTLLQRLRAETQESHQRLESRLDLLQTALSLKCYRDLLARFYGFYVPVEVSLSMWCDTEIPCVQFAQRVKVPLLAQDLKALGWNAMQIAALPMCKALPALRCAPQALGCLYVLEGATLGGQIISRHLQQIHGLNAENGSAFFCSYSDRVGEMWRAFGSALNAYPVGPAEEALIVGAACETFAALETWLCDG